MVTLHYNVLKTMVCWILVTILASVIIITLIILIYVTSNYISTINEQNKMETYLEDKYNTDFIVDKPVRKASGLGVEGWMESTAYPKDNKDLSFQVFSSSGGISDTYVRVTWNSDQQYDVENIAHGIFTKNGLSIRPNIIPTEDLEADIKGSIPSYNRIASTRSSEVKYQIYINGNKSNSYDNYVNTLTSHLSEVNDFLIGQGVDDISLLVTIDGSDGVRHVCTMGSREVISGYIDHDYDIQDCFNSKVKVENE